VGDFSTRSPRAYGALLVLGASSLLLWEWLRDRGGGPWLPGHGHVLAIICAPVFILLGVTFISKGPLAWQEPYFDSRPHFAFGLALGALNAYLLGVWASVGSQGVRELWSSWWWTELLVAAIAAFAILRRSRSRRTDRPDVL